LQHAASPPDLGVPPLWKPTAGWADASSPPHLLTGARTSCYRGGQSEASESQLHAFLASTCCSSTGADLARGPRFETKQIEKIELDQIPFSSHTRPSTLRLLLAFHTVDQQPLFFPQARHHKEENTPKNNKKSTSETREPKPQLNQQSTQRQQKKILSAKVM